MINIEKGSSASAVFILTNLSELIQPVYYVFELINKNSNESTIITGDDLSVNIGHYNLFQWVEGINNPTQSSFILDIGEYHINAYDTQYQYNLNIGSASSLLLQDTLRVNGDANPQYISYTQSDTIKYVYYE